MRETRIHLEAQGKSVQTIQPEAIGQDFNDVLKEGGVTVIQALLSALKTIEHREQPSHRDMNREELLAHELGEKLQRFAQNPSDRELKKDLCAWAKTLHNNADLQAKIQDIDPQMTGEMERLRQEEKREMGLER